MFSKALEFKVRRVVEHLEKSGETRMAQDVEALLDRYWKSETTMAERAEEDPVLMKWMTKRQVARRLGISERTVDRLRHEKWWTARPRRLPFLTQLRFDREEVDRMIRAAFADLPMPDFKKARRLRQAL